MTFNCLSIGFTHFNFTNIDNTALITIVVSVIYTAISVSSFLWISDAISKEAVNESLETRYMRMQFKQMFDNLQEGIIVFQNGKIAFTNDLGLKLMNAVSGMQHFANNLDSNDQ